MPPATPAALANARVLDAWRRRPVDRTPVWLMRQAGRFLPSYREIRARHGFLEMCRTPELVARVTALPVDELGVDAAIVFSDLLLPLEAMGPALAYTDGEGPVLSPAVRTARDVERLAVPDPTDGTGYVLSGIRAARAALAGRVPLVGFAGAPWTLASYLVEGKTSRTFHATKSFAFREPEIFHRLLEKVSETIALYLDAQIEAGADAVQIFDTWAECLSPADYAEFAAPYTRRVIERLRADRGPVVLFVRGGELFLDSMAGSGADCLSLDWRASLGSARRRLAGRLSLQGNLDPSVLAADSATIRARVRAVLADHGPGEGHVFNLGHGVPPDVPPDHVRELVRAVAEESPRFHGVEA